MKDNWNDEKFASDWDEGPAIENPSRARLLDLLVDIVADSYKQDGKILDLGFGTGLVEQMIYKRNPNAVVVGVDSSDVMINKAKDRLRNSKLVAIKHDLTKINSLQIPEGEYQFAITSFVLHEISAMHKQEIFNFIYRTLKPGGQYVLVDRFKIDSKGFSNAYESQWNWQAKSSTWINWKESFAEYIKRMDVGEKEDSPDFLEDQLAWLRKAGFKATCLQLEFDRGLIVAIK